MSEWLDIQQGIFEDGTDGTSEYVADPIDAPPRSIGGLYLYDHNGEQILDHNGLPIGVPYYA